MSLETLHEYITGEYIAVESLEQLPATIDEDVWIRDANGVKLAGYDIVIKDSADDTLVLNTDYVLALKDGNRTILEGFDIWAGYKVVNAVYADIPLFIDIKVVGGYTDRRYRPTYINVDESGTLPFGIRDLMVFADTSVDVIELTVLDAERVNDQITIASYGGQNVVVTGTGIAAVEVLDQATSFIWTGDAYIQIGGLGGGGDLGEIQMPQPKTWVDKGITPGVSITNQWGLGSFVLECEISGIGAGIYTSRIEVEDLAVSAFSNFFTSNGTNNADAKVIYNGSSGAFELTATVSSVAVAINRIQFYEDDPDNLPLQTIPSDPSLIKDWVNKFDDFTNTSNIANVWGDGKYLGVLRGSTNLQKTTSVLLVQTGIDQLPAIDTWGADAYGSPDPSLTYDASANEFIATANSGTWYIAELFRWEDVAGADAQLNPPVDGWELIFTDDDNASPITNIWGEGYYKCVCSISTDVSEAHTSVMQLDSVDENQYGSTANWLAGVRLAYLTSPNEFDITDATYHIKRLYKFNSLVNVLHSYVPDPRSVAQKDWVLIYEDPNNTGEITNVWGYGHYKVSLEPSGGEPHFSELVYYRDDVNNIGGTASAGSDVRAELRVASNTFASSSASYDVRKIWKWQDSQASDAPRTVLDDGWELVFDDYTNTASIPNTFGTGFYRGQIDVAASTSPNTPFSSILYTETPTTYERGSTASYTSNVNIVNNASNAFICEDAAYKIKKLWKFTGLLRIDSQVVTNTSEGSNITNAVIDTDAGDVDCTSYFTDTTQDRVVKLTNDGTNGNHLTNCPNGIEIGDGKTVQFYYNLGWRYEDVCIDEETGTATVNNGSATYTLKKWSGGRFTYSAEGVNTANPHTHTMPVTAVGTSRSFSGNASMNSNASRIIGFGDTTTTGAAVAIFRVNASNALSAGDYIFTFESRWKTGI